MRHQRGWGLIAAIGLLAGCSGAAEDTPPAADDPAGNEDTDASVPVSGGFEIARVQARDANMDFVADVVQLSTGEVVAVGQDRNGQGAVHLVGESAVTVLHAGPPLGSPRGVDLDESETVFVADAGGASSTDSMDPDGLADDGSEFPTGAVFSLSATGGAPALVTDAVRNPQSVVAAAEGVLYATGYTEAQQPAVFSISGGAATAFSVGAPLVRPGDLSVVNDPDNTQLWVIDVSGGQDGVAHGGANLVALNPPDGTVLEVNQGMTAIGVTGRGPDALVTTTDHNGDAQIQIVDVRDGARRDVEAEGSGLSVTVTGAGAGADPALPVWAGGSSGQVYVTSRN